MTFIQTITQAFTQPTPAAITSSSQFIVSKEEFLFIQKAFKEKAHNKTLTAEDILLYNIIRGKDIDRGFTPVTNPTKLANGEGAYKGQRRLFESKSHLRWILNAFCKGSPGPFVVHYGLTRETCSKILEAMK